MVRSNSEAIEDTMMKNIKYDIEIQNVHKGIAHLTISMQKEPLAVIYAQGKTIAHMTAVIDLITAAIELLNARLVELRERDESPNNDESDNPLGWYYRALAENKQPPIVF